MKLTEWYSGDQKPVRVGVYERESKHTKTPTFFHYWDGFRWSGGWYTPERAIKDPSRFDGSSQDDDCDPPRWRGIAK